MPYFILLLCLCLFPFSSVRCEKQVISEPFGASRLIIWGGNGDESLFSAHHTLDGDIVLLALTDSTAGTPALSSRTADGKSDGWMLRVSDTGELRNEALLDWEGVPFILGALKNQEGACMVVVESIDNAESVENRGYIVTCGASEGHIQREALLGLPHDAYVCDDGLLLTGACAVDASHATAWSAFLKASGQLAWSYQSPEDDTRIGFEGGVWRDNMAILLINKPVTAPGKWYFRLLDQNGQFLHDLPLPDLGNARMHGMLPTDEGVLLYGYTFSDTGHAPMFFLHVDLEGHVLFRKTFADMQSVLAVCSAAQGGYHLVENADDGLHVFHLSDDGETELQYSFPCASPMTCRHIDEEPDGSLTCVGDMRIRTPDGDVTEKLFTLHIPQGNH